MNQYIHTHYDPIRNALVFSRPRGEFSNSKQTFNLTLKIMILTFGSNGDVVLPVM